MNDDAARSIVSNMSSELARYIIRRYRDRVPMVGAPAAVRQERRAMNSAVAARYPRSYMPRYVELTLEVAVATLERDALRTVFPLSPIRRHLASSKGLAIKPGDVLSQPVSWPIGEYLFKHASVYVGCDEVVEVSKGAGVMAGSNQDPNLTYIQKGTISMTVEEIKCHGGQTAVSRALENLGKEWDYEMIKNNCQHFAMYCATGKYLDFPGRGYGVGSDSSTTFEKDNIFGDRHRYKT